MYYDLRFSFCNEQNTDPRAAVEPGPCDPIGPSSGASGLLLHPAAVLSAPPGRPGVLHQTHSGGQECPLQTVQLRLYEERQALPQCCSKSGEERRVSEKPQKLTDAFVNG